MEGEKNTLWKPENGPAVGQILYYIMTEIVQLLGVCFWFVQLRVLSAVTGSNRMLRHMGAEREKKGAHTISILNIYYLICERDKLVGWNEKTSKKSKVVVFRKRHIPLIHIINKSLFWCLVKGKHMRCVFLLASVFMVGSIKRVGETIQVNP